VKALLPTIESLDPSAGASVGAVPGTYTLTLTNSGSVATGGSISITAPEGSGSPGNATVTLTAAVTHDNDAIVAPTNATGHHPGPSSATRGLGVVGLRRQLLLDVTTDATASR